MKYWIGILLFFTNTLAAQVRTVVPKLVPQKIDYIPTERGHTLSLDHNFYYTSTVDGYIYKINLTSKKIENYYQFPLKFQHLNMRIDFEGSFLYSFGYFIETDSIRLAMLILNCKSDSFKINILASAPKQDIEPIKNNQLNWLDYFQHDVDIWFVIDKVLIHGQFTNDSCIKISRLKTDFSINRVQSLSFFRNRLNIELIDSRNYQLINDTEFVLDTTQIVTFDTSENIKYYKTDNTIFSIDSSFEFKELTPNLFANNKKYDIISKYLKQIRPEFIRLRYAFGNIYFIAKKNEIWSLFFYRSSADSIVEILHPNFKCYHWEWEENCDQLFFYTIHENGFVYMQTNNFKTFSLYYNKTLIEINENKNQIPEVNMDIVLKRVNYMDEIDENGTYFKYFINHEDVTLFNYYGDVDLRKCTRKWDRDIVTYIPQINYTSKYKNWYRDNPDNFYNKLVGNVGENPLKYQLPKNKVFQQYSYFSEESKWSRFGVFYTSSGQRLRIDVQTIYKIEYTPDGEIHSEKDSLITRFYYKQKNEYIYPAFYSDKFTEEDIGEVKITYLPHLKRELVDTNFLFNIPLLPGDTIISTKQIFEDFNVRTITLVTDTLHITDSITWNVVWKYFHENSRPFAFSGHEYWPVAYLNNRKIKFFQTDWSKYSDSNSTHYILEKNHVLVNLEITQYDLVQIITYDTNTSIIYVTNKRFDECSQYSFPKGKFYDVVNDNLPNGILTASDLTHPNNLDVYKNYSNRSLEKLAAIQVFRKDSILNDSNKFIMLEGNVFVSTVEGYVDGPLNSLKNLTFSIEDQLYSFEEVKALVHYPGVLQDILDDRYNMDKCKVARSNFKPLNKIAQFHQNENWIHFNSTFPILEDTIFLTQKNIPFQSINHLLNFDSSILFYYISVDSIKKIAAKYDFQSLGMKISHMGNMPAIASPLNIYPLNSLPNYFGLFIGQKYSGLESWNTGPENAKALCKAFNAIQGTTQHKNKFITDENRPVSKAQIMEELQYIENNAKKEDIVTIFYSGHGIIHEATNQYFLIPSEATDSNDLTGLETIEIGELQKLAISVNDLQDFVKNCKSEHITIILDACYSAKAIMQFKFDSKVQNWTNTALNSQGVNIIAATTENKTARAQEVYKHSIFTYSFLQKILELSRKQENSPLYLSEILADLQQHTIENAYRMLKLTAEQHSNQLPMYNNFDANFIIGYSISSVKDSLQLPYIKKPMSIDMYYRQNYRNNLVFSKENISKLNRAIRKFVESQKDTAIYFELVSTGMQTKAKYTVEFKELDENRIQVFLYYDEEFNGGFKKREKSCILDFKYNSTAKYDDFYSIIGTLLNNEIGFQEGILKYRIKHKRSFNNPVVQDWQDLGP